MNQQEYMEAMEQRGNQILHEGSIILQEMRAIQERLEAQPIIYAAPDCSTWINAALFLVGTIFGAALIILAAAIWG